MDAADARKGASQNDDVIHLRECEMWPIGVAMVVTREIRDYAGIYTSRRIKMGL